jgi:hypothetical protein
MSIPMYTDGQYLAQNPTWHVEDSALKAGNILAMIRRHGLAPQTICEIGSGAGEILVQLQKQLPESCRFTGYDISPQAHALSLPRSNNRLDFRLGDVTDAPGSHFDLMLIVDVIEHLDDYYGFLRRLKPFSGHKILHIPLDLSAYGVLRVHPILDLRKAVGHIHCFTKDTALAALRDAGYEVIDSFYTDGTHPLRGRPFRQKVLGVLRETLYKLAPDYTVRLLGGRSLMVLVR